MIFVLIDTWWNVNAEECHTLILTDTVLIDTWWNVNKLMLAGVFPDALRFNRYMVECESSLSSCNCIIVFVLIDTWWNVNTKYASGGSSCHSVLIDTWWNVNDDVKALS